MKAEEVRALSPDQLKEELLKLKHALTLSLEERAEIAAQLLASLDGEREDDVEHAIVSV